MRIPFGERPAGGNDKTDLGGGSFERFGGPSLQRAPHRRLVVTTAEKLKQSVAMMRQIRMQPRPAAVAAAVQPSDLVVVIIRVLAVDAQVTLATEFDRRVAHFDRHALAPPPRSRQSSAAARAAAPIVAWAAVPTANDDGSTGSLPVKATSSKAASSSPASLHNSISTSAGSRAAIALPHDRAAALSTHLDRNDVRHRRRRVRNVRPVAKHEL